MKTILEQINQARYISINCRLKAAEIEQKIKNIKHSNNTKIWIKNDRKKDALKREIEMLNNRADKVWGAVTDFQGKYINWKNLHTVEGVTYCGILELINASFSHSSINKYPCQ